MRIISLVPSITQTLCQLDLKDSIVGCTNYCVRPKGLHKTSTLIGGTKDPNLELILSLQPTHILVNTEENRAIDIKELTHKTKQTPCIIVEFFPQNFADVSMMINKLGELFKQEDKANDISNKIIQLESKLKPKQDKTFLYFIWQQPYMLAGSGTFISNLLCSTGLKNLCIEKNYPQITINEIKRLNPDLIILSSEPYPFKKRDVLTLQKELQGYKGTFLKADGQLTSWHGALCIEALEELSKFNNQKENDILKKFSNT